MDPKQFFIANIKQEDSEVIELLSPCLYVLDQMIEGKREKRRLYHCFNVQTKKEYYKVELNMGMSKQFNDIDGAYDCLFSEKPF